MAFAKENPIWCVPAKHLPDNSGVLSNNFRVEHIRGRLVSVPREKAEEDPNWRQIVPYIVITTPNHEHLLRYRRGQQSSQTDLVKKYSIGFGGHIKVTRDTPIYFDSNKSFWQCIARHAVRELNQELGIDNVLHHPLRNRMVEVFDNLTGGWLSGITQVFTAKLENQIYYKLKTKQYQFIHRGDTHLNKCHLGLCLVVNLDMCEIKASELGQIEDLSWQSSYDLRQANYSNPGELEPWSQAALIYASDLEYAHKGSF